MKKPRLALATELPLDDGARTGCETWREVEGVAFCHWDRWLLRLALEEPDGLRSVEGELQRRATVPGRIDKEAEAFLMQIADLAARLERARRDASTLLDEEERASTWLRDKAHRRVWHASSIRHCTAAMLRTPRIVLEERALRGNWDAYPVNPSSYADELRSVVGEGWYDYRVTGLVVAGLEATSSTLLRGAHTDFTRLAVHRAVLTVGVVTMEGLDDAWELVEYVREHEQAYLQLLRTCDAIHDLLADYLELVVWEDYGLLTETASFLGSLAASKAARAEEELTRIEAELRSAHCESQRDKAGWLRRALPGQSGIGAT